MAAMLTDRLLTLWRGYRAADSFAIARRKRRRSMVLATSWNPAWQYLALLWMLAVVAFSLLIAAGATGILG